MGSCLLPSFHTVFEMPQKERESARVERINEQHKHEWLNSGGRGGRRLLKRRERWKTDTILLSRSAPGSTSPWPWLIHMDGPVTERRGWRTVKNGLMWGCTATGVHMAPEAPTRSHDKRGLCSQVASSSNLSGNSLSQSPLSSAEPLTFLPAQQAAEECAFCKPALARGLPLHLLASYYCNGWCKECCAIE